METIKFTKSAILAIAPDPQKRREYSDSVLPGLRLRVTPSGVKSFCVARYREGKFIRVTLGKFPDLTVDQAREMAARTLGEVATTRQNPNDQRQAAVTLADALAEYLKSRAQRIKQTTIDQFQRIATEGSITRRRGIVDPVGSVLDNGDEIISTPQGHTYLVTREGIVPGADFLTVTGA